MQIKRMEVLKYIIHDEFYNPYGLEDTFEKAETKLEEVETKYGMKGKLSVSALGIEK